MDILNDILKNIWVTRITWSIITIIIGSLVYKLFSKTLTLKLENKDIKVLSNNKRKTYVKMIKSIVRYIIIIIIVLVILQIFGVNISSMIAGVGILSIIIGFAIQDALKDIIKGIDIISDNYYSVGDVIKFGDITGKVLVIGIKTTKIQDVVSMNIISIANRNIEQVEIVSDLINIDVPIPYEVDVKKAEEAIDAIVKSIKKQKNVDNAEYRGINELADSSLKYQIKVYCNPEIKVQTRRDALRCIIMGLSEHNISVPYNQLDIHKK